MVERDGCVGDVRSAQVVGTPVGTSRNGSIASVRVYVILDQRSSPEPPLGDAVETFVQREDAGSASSRT